MASNVRRLVTTPPTTSTIAKGVPQLHAGLQQPQLSEEAGERRNARKVHGRNKEQQRKQWRELRKATQTVNGRAAAAPLYETCDQEQAGLHGDVVRNVENRSTQPGHGTHGEAKHHIADVANKREGQETFDVALGQGAQNSDNHGE